MKTAREYISALRLNRANVEHILDYGNVNGTLLIDLENTLHAYAEEVAQQALKDAAENVHILTHTGKYVSVESILNTHIKTP